VSRHSIRKEGAICSQTILYPPDFSDVAIKALDYIDQLKNAGTEEVMIFHIIDQRSIDVMSEMRRTESQGKGSEDFSKKEISPFLKGLAPGG